MDDRRSTPRTRPRSTRLADQAGFSLIELLVVILIVGVLAAIAIPVFLSQRGKATDASAKELARTAETTAETIATDNNGSYAKVSQALLSSYEPTIPTSQGSADGNAWLSAAGPINVGSGTANGYTVVTTAAGGTDQFTITNSAGTVSRACSPTSVQAGCANGTW